MTLHLPFLDEMEAVFDGQRYYHGPRRMRAPSNVEAEVEMHNDMVGPILVKRRLRMVLGAAIKLPEHADGERVARADDDIRAMVARHLYEGVHRELVALLDEMRGEGLHKDDKPVKHVMELLDQLEQRFIGSRRHGR